MLIFTTFASGSKRFRGGNYEGFLDVKNRACGHGILTFSDGRSESGTWDKDL